MKSDFISRARGVSDLKAHLVLTTKYRRKVFTGEMINRLDEILKELLKKWDCEVVDFNGESDHVHLIFRYTPQTELPKFINNVKTVTSRYLRKEFAIRINQFYKKDVLWNGSYFIASCGGVTVETLKKYVESQNKPE
ncbi:MAG: IS200/IS605 family transposase [Cyanomargarita calcarea GSE-NOS-MK-12-04C]|uniref:IS200/IS605 family transposase n=1 Tax=Cyanomargarita calcarea GSE-NOS-MK-12-04C TaxID=2839659 RepID=A0A951QNN8_9CYAN|nr:IS200/IS605 family transposase [Cyanomargarita calcarea GSE-NOS-MK-12-04C]